MKRLAAAALLACLPLALPASAQVNPFATAFQSRLSGADIDVMIKASQDLLAQPHLRAGSAADWRNDASGAHGHIRVVNTFHRHDLECHKVAYTGGPKDARPGKPIMVNWCRAPDGWKMA